MLPIPAFAARLAFGELADEGLLASARVEPKKLLASGFEFQFPELGAALSDLV
jgi:NAD dependent epimerase/dehydratase family enzyme